MTNLINDVNKDIKIKNDIKEKAKKRTLSSDDWN